MMFDCLLVGVVKALRLLVVPIDVGMYGQEYLTAVTMLRQFQRFKDVSLCDDMMTARSSLTTRKALADETREGQMGGGRKCRLFCMIMQ